MHHFEHNLLIYLFQNAKNQQDDETEIDKAINEEMEEQLAPVAEENEDLNQKKRKSRSPEPNERYYLSFWVKRASSDFLCKISPGSNPMLRKFSAIFFNFLLLSELSLAPSHLSFP